MIVTPAATTAMNGDNSEAALHRVLVDRCRSLEASYAKIKEQFDVLVREQRVKKVQEEVTSGAGVVASYAGSFTITGVFSAGSPYRGVLECMGHAIFVSRAVSEDIIYWNRSAEKLYGYKDYEVLGQRVLELLIDDENYASAEKIMGKLSSGQSWSGQFPFKKRSGEIFMALVNKSPFYEDGELVGVITVSSDAALFNKIDSENLRAYQDPSNGQTRVRGLNLKKIQWRPQSQVASFVSNLASKDLLRKRGADIDNTCTTSRDGEESILERLKMLR